MSKYLDLDGLTLFKSKNDGLYETKANVTTLAGRVTTAEGDIDALETSVAAKQDKLVAGSNIQIAADGKTISATDTTYNDATTSAHGLMSAADKTKLDGVASEATKVAVAASGTATDEVAYISVNGVEKKIKDTTYSAGTNVTINNGVIAATDTKYTAGSNVAISDTNVISATDTTYTAGTNVTITGTVISAKDTTYTAGSGISITNGVISCTAGLKLHICQTGEYDPTTRIPTIASPDASTIYLVPKSTAAGNNAYDEWIYTNSAWEKIGSTELTIESITNAEINALFA